MISTVILWNFARVGKEKLCELLNNKSQTANQCMDNISKLNEMTKTKRYVAPTDFRSSSNSVG